MKLTVLVPLAKGFEEMEAVLIIDVLRRAEIEVVVAGLDGPGPVLGSRGITVIAEASMEDAAGRSFDAVVLPADLGGTLAMRDNPRVVAAVAASWASGKLTAAICAAPLVLKEAELAEVRTLTVHPSVHDEMRAVGANIGKDLGATRVVCDGHLSTSQGPGTAIEFALAVVGDQKDQATADSTSAAMCVG